MVKASAVAQSDLAAALQLLESSKDRMEREAVIEGIFSWLAVAVPPDEALRHALALKDEDQFGARKALAVAWLGAGNGDFNSAWLMSDKRGFITAAAELLSASPNVPAGAAKAWMETFAENPARAAIAGSYAAAHILENPAEALGLAKDFTAWERRQFLDAAIPSWAAKDPAAALAWFRGQNEPLPDSLRGRIFDVWAQANLDSARDQLATLSDPAERLEMARALGRVMATQGTREAVAWADSLNDPAVQDAAHEAIYEATPRGIGTVMGNEGGFPIINGVLPGSVAQQAGLREGDRLVEITSGSGEFTPLYGKALEDVVTSIRGEPGQPASIRILRNGSDGRPFELVLELTRQQLVLPPPKTWPPN